MNYFEKVFFAASLLAQKVRYTISPQKRIHLLGDSLMAGQPWYKYPRTGWGTQLKAFINSDRIRVINHARNGASTMSFNKFKHFKKALRAIKENDIVIVGFAHNDQFYKPANGELVLNVFEALLTGFVNELKNQKAIIFLGTPITRYNLSADHGSFPEAIKVIAQKTNVGLIDLHAYSEDLQYQLGEEKVKELYLIAAPGRFIMHPDGIQDHIHLSPYGAQVFAKYAADVINQLI
jgi:lysophospholipase L1-like esterase